MIFKNQKISKIFGSLRNFFLLYNTLKTEQKLFLENFFFVPEKKIVSLKKNFTKNFCYWDPMWKISIHRDFDSLGGPLSPCGSHWLR